MFLVINWAREWQVFWDMGIDHIAPELHVLIIAAMFFILPLIMGLALIADWQMKRKVKQWSPQSSLQKPP